MRCAVAAADSGMQCILTKAKPLPPHTATATITTSPVVMPSMKIRVELGNGKLLLNSVQLHCWLLLGVSQSGNDNRRRSFMNLEPCNNYRSAMFRWLFLLFTRVLFGLLFFSFLAQHRRRRWQRRRRRPLQRRHDDSKVFFPHLPVNAGVEIDSQWWMLFAVVNAANSFRFGCALARGCWCEFKCRPLMSKWTIEQMNAIHYSLVAISMVRCLLFRWFAL